MDNKELEQKIQEMVAPLFKVLNIQRVNHDPHPYTIGPRHVTWTADHRGGMLTEEAIIAAEKAGVRCAVSGCQVSYKDHKSKKVLFLQLTREGTVDEANAAISPIKEILEAEHIDGIGMVETEEKFRIV